MAAGFGAEGAAPDCALDPFLSEEFTEVAKGCRPNVRSKIVKGEYSGFGDASAYWMPAGLCGGAGAFAARTR